MLLSLKYYGYKNYRIEPLCNQVWARDFDIRIYQIYIVNNNAIDFFKIVLPPPFNGPPGRVGMEAANESFPFFKPRPEGRGR